jgi:hypothetical protein
MTLFKILCRACGLSLREAALYLDARPDSISAWSQGKRNAPPGVIEELAGLASDIDLAVACWVKRNVCLDDVVKFDLADMDGYPSPGWSIMPLGSKLIVIGRICAWCTAKGRKFELPPRPCAFNF